MQLPLQLTFRSIRPSASLRTYVERRAAKLDTFDPRIMSCRVVVEAPHHHMRHGKNFHVRVEVRMPRRELVVDREPPEHQKAQDIHSTIDEAFDEMGRRIEESVRVRRGHVKQHEPTYQHGHVARVFRARGYGFVEKEDGGEVYFHENAVQGKRFGTLAKGAHVKFVEESGEHGPQASTVIVERSRPLERARHASA